MYPTKLFGGFGTISTPTEQAWGHYASGILHEKEEAATPFTIVSNGVIERNMAADARFNGNLGRVTIPAVPILQDIRNDMKLQAGELLLSVREKIGAFLSRENDPSQSLIHSTHEYMDILNRSTGEEPMMAPTKDDFMVQTFPLLENKSIVGFKDLYYRYYLSRKPTLIELCNNIQSEFTDIVRTVRGAPRMAKVGYAMMEKQGDGLLSIRRRPSRYTRFNVNVARLDITVDPFMNTPLRMQAAYIWLLGQQMKKMLEYKYPGVQGGIGGYTDADYCALANSWLLQASGSGEIKIEKVYSAADIVEQMLHSIGQNVAEAFPFLPLTDDAWEEMFEFWLIGSMVAARCKATTLTGDIYLHSARNAIRAPYDFERYTQANLPGFGSMGTPYYFMARNQLANDFVMPAVMRYDKFEDREFDLKDLGAEDEPNVYDILIQKNPISFGTADVSRGEIAGNPLDPLKDDIYLKFVIHPDTRIWDIEYSMNAVRMYRFPIYTTMGNANTPEEAIRMQMYLIGQFFNGKANMKEGFFCAPGIGALNINMVKTAVNRLGLELVEKQQTGSSQEQMSSPNTVIPGKSNKVLPPESAIKTPMPGATGALTPAEVKGDVNLKKEDAEAIMAEGSK